MQDTNINIKDKLSRAEKHKNNKQWFKDKSKSYDITSESSTLSSAYHRTLKDRMQVNYNLKNNILDIEKYSKVCKPFGDLGDDAEGGHLAAEMTNRDIINPKFKAVLSLATKRPFGLKLLAVNKEATTRREVESVKQIRDYTISQIMTPIKQSIEEEYQEEMQGELSDEQREEIQQKIAEEEKKRTPEEVQKYMAREHQDPAEILFNQILNYQKEKQKLDTKFGKALEHGLTSAVQTMYVGELGGKLRTWNINSLDLTYDCNSDLDKVHEGDYVTCRYRMSPARIVELFGDNLSEKDIDTVYSRMQAEATERMNTLSFDFSTDKQVRENDYSNTVTVIHTVFTSLRRLKFLTRDEEGEEVIEVVDETYKLDLDAGDISIESKWFPSKYETWRIGEDLYPIMRLLPGQFEDLNNLGNFPLPYIGVIHDNTNTHPVSFIERLEDYQFNINVIYYKLDNLINSDEGKKVLMNINAIPDSANMSMKEWQYFAKTTPYMWFDPTEEGSSYNDVNTIAKQLDMSLMSDISKYIEIAENIRHQAGRSVGVTDSVEGQTTAREAVRNNQQNLIQTSNILEPYFNLHNQFKKDVVQQVLDVCKVIYRDSPTEDLAYYLDDMSIDLLKMDTDLLNTTKIGLFVSDSNKAFETKELLTQLSHAAMQNQTLEMSDVIEMFEQDSLAETKDRLRVAEARQAEKAQQQQQQQQQAEAEAAKKMEEYAQKAHAREMELIILKEEENRKTEMMKASIMAASFNPDQDKDEDGENDFIEIAKNGLDADIARSKHNLELDKLSHQKEIDKEKLNIEKMKINKVK